MENISIIVLGISQDGGFPHTGCKKICCKESWNNPDNRRNASCIGIADLKLKKYYLIDATPDIKYQLNFMENKFPGYQLTGIFLTHAHIGHYTGLIHFGKEIMNSKKLPVYVMPKMKNFLSENLPWKQLIESENIELFDLKNGREVNFNQRIYIKPFVVPHRDEHSETVGFEINSENYKTVYIPDIDTWEKWGQDICEVIKNSNELFLDGTFFDESEVKDYYLKNIPHPLVTDSMKKFVTLNSIEKSKVNFIHLNHTNPLIRKDSEERNEVISNGFKIAFEGQMIEM